ncbi:MAG: putative short chain dehydrogenase [Streblomastix strix]|uniref:Putative short chain dehydrogenase n=1 Tax=Streblomastix strix TaxID=222440 RepID=A0A5J4X2G5_9EUKA|nr:MAG: putative short chain dehydrogenase [Streblomastix strix]
MFTEIFVVLGIIFLLSLLGYLIPQLIVCFSKPLDLKTRYGGGYAFITGGNSGIGESFAKKLAKQGFNLIILAQNEERLNQTKAALKEIDSTIDVRTIKADLSGDPVQVTKDIVQQLEGLDISILYFNAGLGVMDKTSSPTEKTLHMFQSNIVTHQYLFQELYPKLANRQTATKRRGGVLFTSSGLAFLISPGSVVYAATKAYMGHLGECLATEAESDYGIDVVSIYPGITNTRFFKREQEEAKMPKMMEMMFQSPDQVAGYALSGLGRVTRVDSGFQGIFGRIVMKLIDANIFIKIVQKAGSLRKKNIKPD